MTSDMNWLCQFFKKRRLAAMASVTMLLGMWLWVQTSLVVLEPDISLERSGVPQRSITLPPEVEEAEPVERVLEARRAHYQDTCDRMHWAGGVPGLVQTPLVYLPANLSVCWVPKVGCTFWMRVFFYLYNDTQSPWLQKPVQSPFDIDRLFVHYDGARASKTMHFSDAHEHDVIFHTRRVMFARDPWSRLWSGYIDKFVLPDSWLDHGKQILRVRKHTTPDWLLTSSHGTPRPGHQDSNATTEQQDCAMDVSFAEFLYYALLLNDDPHWAPVHLTCNPCTFRPHLLGKLETFSTDSSYVLRTSGLQHLLGDSSHLAHIKDEVKQLADYHFRLWDRRPALHACLDPVGLARRLWQAFQLNGYLPVTSTFPEQLLTRQLKSVTIFAARDLFTHHVLSLASAASHDLSQWSALRRRTMVAAYRTVPQELLKALQERFKLDFELFQYDPSPSDLFSTNMKS